ncbi:MAG: response regulator, partial [Lachnospiraceae bacterium]|nr:response regulator [Lachnospiraceae bacterium]
VTNFNKLDIAFHVDQVLGIHRVSWADIIKPGTTISTTEEGVSTGIIKMNDKLIIILDFEKIVADINPETGLKVSDIDAIGARPRNSIPILIAEDSVLLNKLIVDSLKKAGYENLIHTENGQEAYDVITDCKEKGTLKDHVQCIVTDIEMPLMDGHRLTKLVKSDDATKNIPVVIFSSLVNEEMRRKGEALGADAQLSKPEIGKLVQIIDGLVLNK